MSFQIGDVVQLKSGGPKMTVEQLGKDFVDREQVWCVWFEKNERKEGTFPPQALVAV